MAEKLLDQSLVLRVPEPLKAALQREADSRGLKVSDIVREALNGWTRSRKPSSTGARRAA